MFSVPAHWGLGEIDGLLVSPGKVSDLLKDHLITGKPLMSEPAQESGGKNMAHTTCPLNVFAASKGSSFYILFSQTIHTYKPYWLSWVVIFIKHILSVMTS